MSASSSFPKRRDVDSTERIVRERELEPIDGLSRSTRRREIAAGRYPKAIQLTDYTIGWRLSEVQAWIDARPRSSSGNHAAVA